MKVLCSCSQRTIWASAFPSLSSPGGVGSASSAPASCWPWPLRAALESGCLVCSSSTGLQPRVCRTPFPAAMLTSGIWDSSAGWHSRSCGLQGRAVRLESRLGRPAWTTGLCRERKQQAAVCIQRTLTTVDSTLTLSQSFMPPAFTSALLREGQYCTMLPPRGVTQYCFHPCLHPGSRDCINGAHRTSDSQF